MAVSGLLPYRIGVHGLSAAAPTTTHTATPAPRGPIDSYIGGLKNNLARVTALRDAFEVGQLSGYGAGLRGEAQPALPPTGDAALDAARTQGLAAGFAKGAERRALLEGTKANGFEEARAAANAGAVKPVPADYEDPEIIAARQEGLDAGWAQGLEDQKAICFEEGRKAGRGEQPQQLEPGDLSTDLGQVQWSAYTQGVAAGKLEALPPGAEAAIDYALNPPKNPNNPTGAGQGWAYWCLGMVRRAYEGAGNTDAAARLAQPDAKSAYNVYANEGRIQTEGVPPRGAVVFFEWGKEGHVGISLGDGTYVGTETNGNTGIRPYTQGGSAYLGWAIP